MKINKFNFQFRERNQAKYQIHEWKNLDDTLFMDELYKHHTRLAPYIKRLINGEVLSYTEGEYRICLAK